MDAVSALLYAAKGIRAVLGAYPTSLLRSVSASILERQAEELVAIARLEAAPDTPEATITVEGLRQAALRRRLRDLYGDAPLHRDVAAHTDACPQDCDHVANMLLAPDREVRSFVQQDRLAGMKQGAVVEAVGKLGRALGGGPGGLFLAGGSITAPGDDPEDD